MAMQKTKLINIGIMSATITIVLIVFEISLRLFYPMQLEHIIFDKEMGYVKIPNWSGYLRNPHLFRYEYFTPMKWNSIGLNDDEIIGKESILFLGDSFVMGIGVERGKNFCDLLEQRMGKEVINAGTGGYNIGHYLKFLRMNRFNISTVFVGLFMGNDMQTQSLYKLKDGELVEKDTKEYSKWMRFRRFLSRNSHLYVFTVMAVYRREKYMPLHDLSDYNPMLNEMLIKAIMDVAKGRNQKLVFVLIPFREQVDDSFFEKEYMNNTKIGRFQFQEDAIKILEKHNITYINVLEDFRKLNKNNSLYYKIDGHFNEEGHKLMADIIGGYCEQTDDC